MNLASHYVTYADFGDMGIGHGCDPASFDDALDAYFEHRSNGLDACVMRYDAPIGSKCGIMVDVTDDAQDALKRRLRARGEYDWPAWLTGEEATCPDCHRASCACDAAYEQRVSDDLHRWAAE